MPIVAAFLFSSCGLSSSLCVVIPACHLPLATKTPPPPYLAVALINFALLLPLLLLLLLLLHVALIETQFAAINVCELSSLIVGHEHGYGYGNGYGIQLSIPGAVRMCLASAEDLLPLAPAKLEINVLHSRV